MAFDKEKYWKEKKNNVGSKRPKATLTESGDAETTFVEIDGVTRLATKNRAYRRSVMHDNKLQRRKGYIERLNAIRVVRKRNGKTKVKYVPVYNDEVVRFNA